MPIVRTDIPITWESSERMIRELVEAYPFCRTEVIGRSDYGRQLRALCIGNGPRRVLYSAAHHANEWITALVLLKFAEELAEAIQTGGDIYGYDALQFSREVTVCLVPMVNPDGVDLVVGEIEEGTPPWQAARALADNYPDIPFPDGWKANLKGVDLNLQYPAGWRQAREIKFSQGFTRPGPRDYVGRAPLSQPEARAMAEYTAWFDPQLVLAYHSQGKEIYWQFGDFVVPGARELGEAFARVSGYTLADPAEESSYAGYKDWFIQEFRRPGYTVEVGQGVNPLPLDQFGQIYRDNLGILVLAALGRTEL